MTLQAVSIASISPEFYSYILMHACMLSCFSCVWFSATPCTVARQAPLSMGILQARILEWVDMPSSRASSQPRDQTQISYVSCMGTLPQAPPRKPIYPYIYHLALLLWVNSPNPPIPRLNSWSFVPSHAYIFFIFFDGNIQLVTKDRKRRLVIVL